MAGMAVCCNLTPNAYYNTHLFTNGCRATLQLRTVSQFMHGYLQSSSHLVEASEGITTKTDTTDTAGGRVNESASQTRERIASHFQPGMSFLQVLDLC